MTMLQTISTISGDISPFISTSAADDTSLAQPDTSYRDEWDKLISHKLIEWGMHPSMLDDDGVIAPTAKAISQASQFALHLRDAGIATPTAIVPNGDGGIAFHWNEEGKLELFEVLANGQTQISVFVGGQLKQQGPLVTWV